MTAPLNFESFIPSLLRVAPELNPLFDEHIHDYGELLEHVFLGEVTRFIISNYKNGTNLNCLNRILTLLDEAISSKDAKLQELISVSFLENLPQNDESFRGVKKLLSENLCKELARYE